MKRRKGDRHINISLFKPTQADLILYLNILDVKIFLNWEKHVLIFNVHFQKKQKTDKYFPN